MTRATGDHYAPRIVRRRRLALLAVVGASRLFVLLVALVGGLLATSAPAQSQGSSADTNPGSSARYYLSLGDSLALGEQADGDTNRGYADQLFAALAEEMPHLNLVKLGCSGETSRGILTGAGGIDPPRGCYSPDGYKTAYPNGGNQLKEALHLIDKHPDKVRALTLNVGANDVMACLYPTYFPSCFEKRVQEVGVNVLEIMTQLSSALNPPGDDPVPIVGMTYWDPFIYWGAAGADYSAGIAKLNEVLLDAYTKAGVEVARVDAVFQTVDDTCRWTTYCQPPYNYHPNTEGYGVIARTFYDVLGKR